MPGKLKTDAWCPVCGRKIIALSRITGPGGKGALEFIHEPAEQPEDCRMMFINITTMDRIHDRLTEAL